MKTIARLGIVFSTAALAALPIGVAAQQAVAIPNDYSESANWLCRPDRDDACAVDLSTTIVGADGSLATEDWAADPDAPVDCFYVYPTVSTDQSPNSDMSPDEAEMRVIHQQFARFASVCRPYAPSYRQVTLAGLMARLQGGGARLTEGMPFEDVRDAFRHYLEHDSDGRGFVLIGHSQGAYVLRQLISTEIDGTPLQDRLVSALLLGANVSVETGSDIGGAFQSIPTCKSERQTGCLITYASFRSNVPPPETTRFGIAEAAGESAACTNPAALSGGTGELHAHLSSSGTSLIGQSQPAPWASGATVETPFVSVPGLLSAECKTNENATYLEVTVNADPDDPRVDDITGDLTPDWGLHLIDVNLAMGDLVRIVGAQVRAWDGT